LKVYDWSPDDRKAVFCEFISQNIDKLWVIDVTTGEKTLLSPFEGQVDEYYRTPQFSKDGKGIYVITNNNSEMRQLAYLDLKTKKFEYLTPDIKWEVDDFSLSPDGKIIAFTTNEDGISKFHFFDTRTRQIKQISSVPFGIISDLKW